MKFNNVPSRRDNANILGFGPDIKFDKDRLAKTYGYKSFNELKNSGNIDHIKMVEGAETTFEKNKREISPWMESHVRNVDTVNDLVDAVNVLETRIDELTARLALLEGK